MFERFESRYDIRGRVTTLTGLHVGAGTSLEVTGSDNPILRDINGLPYIPGSSFKGVLRSTVEAIVRAISPGKGMWPWACDPLGEMCIQSTKIKEWEDKVRRDEITREELDRKVWEKSCTVCRLFGSPWLASKVKVCDLYLNPSGKPNKGEEEEKSAEWLGRIEVRNGVAIDRDTETVYGGRLYDYEVVPRETVFNLNMRVDNAGPEELGLLFLGLREFMEGEGWLGGNAFGRVRVELDEIEKVEGRDGLLRYLKRGKGDSVEDIGGFVEEKVGKFLETLKEGSEDAQEAP